MVIGVGVDIVEISRFKKTIKNDKFMHKIFTENEIYMINKNPSKAAGNFAVKEAVVKVTGLGFLKFNPRDIEVLRDELGAPKLNLYNYAKKYFEEKNIKLNISISNTKDIAIAYAVGDV